MASFHLIRKQLAEAAADAVGVRQVHDRVPDKLGVIPAVVVVPGEPVALYHQTAHGGHGSLAQFNFDVIVFASRYGNQHGQTEIDTFLGTGDGSIIDALEADQTLGNTASIVQVVSAADYGQIQVADSEYVGVRFVVEVHA